MKAHLILLQLSLLYKNDGAGLNSVGTGFFMLFKEGQLNFQDTNISIQLKTRYRYKR